MHQQVRGSSGDVSIWIAFTTHQIIFCQRFRRSFCIVSLFLWVNWRDFPFVQHGLNLATRWAIHVGWSFVCVDFRSSSSSFGRLSVHLGFVSKVAGWAWLNELLWILVIIKVYVIPFDNLIGCGLALIRRHFFRSLPVSALGAALSLHWCELCVLGRADFPAVSAWSNIFTAGREWFHLRLGAWGHLGFGSIFLLLQAVLGTVNFLLVFCYQVGVKHFPVVKWASRWQLTLILFGNRNIFL